MRFLNLSTKISLNRLQCGVALATMCVATMAAQAQTQPVVAQASQGRDCPMMVTARYVPGAALRPVNPGTPGEARKPLNLSFGPASTVATERITQAQVTVRGMTEKGGVIPAGTAPGSPLLERNFSVNVAANAAGLQSGTVWLTGFGGVGDVRIDSITYGNGRVWKLESSQSCHALTGGVMNAAE
jgi:hypothetical protein